MKTLRSILLFALLPTLAALTPRLEAQETDTHRDDLARLVAAMLGDTPLVSDLRSLTRDIGGRATGSPANLRSVDWSLERFHAAGARQRSRPRSHRLPV